MFIKNISTEPIPERVLELCRLAQQGMTGEQELKEIMEPQSLNKQTDYFGKIRDAAAELKLIQYNHKEATIIYIGDVSTIKDPAAFRRYCNRVLFTDPQTDFYKLTRAFLDSNISWLKYTGYGAAELISDASDRSGINITAPMLRGIRFWLSFLGFGYVQEGQKIQFLPDMTIAIKDCMSFCNLVEEREYSVSEFIDALSQFIPCAFESGRADRQLNCAVSNAFRNLHDSGKITLKKNLDSKEVWNMTVSKTHQLSSEVTHIVIKGATE